MGITKEGTAEEYSVCSEIVTCKCDKESATVKSKTYSHLIKTSRPEWEIVDMPIQMAKISKVLPKNEKLQVIMECKKGKITPGTNKQFPPTIIQSQEVSPKHINVRATLNELYRQ